MEIEQIKEKLRDDFDADGIETRLKKKEEEAMKNRPVPLPPPVDIYQSKQERVYEVNQKKFPKGSSYVVNMAVNAVVGGAGGEGLARAFKRAKGDSDALGARGERGRAELRKQQYMQENFLPAVEIVVNSTSPDEVLNSKKALDELDKYVLLEGSGKGYTASYIRQAYGNQLGQQEGRSDPSVKEKVRRINMLLDDGQVRTAYSMASGLKDKIDKGEAMADDIDYELIGRVVAYFS